MHDLVQLVNILLLKTGKKGMKTALYIELLFSVKTKY